MPRNMFKNVMILDGARYATIPCGKHELEDDEYYFMYFDETNYVVQIQYNAYLERTVIIPKFVFGDVDQKELYRTSQWMYVRNNYFMELNGADCHIFYKCEYLSNHDNILNIDMDFTPEFM